MKSSNISVYTIGHSTRTIDEFVTLLRTADIERVIDIRSIPRSRTNPQYNLDTLPDLLAQFGIKHTQILELGGLRKKSKNVSPDINAFWLNESFHNYADYAFSNEFETGLSQLLALGKTQRCAIMCSEAVWWRCHRRIVADYLLIRHIQVFHLMDKNKSVKAVLNPAACVHGRTLTYPAAESSNNHPTEASGN